MMAKPDIESPHPTLCIVGLGLMGGSLALAVRDRYHVLGVARRPETAHLALERGVVHAASTNMAESVAQADLVVLATPVRTLVEQIAECAPHMRPGAIITDLGSTKRAVVAAMDRLPETIRAVGSHPMCGKEIAGLDAADGELYRGRTWILTRTQRTDEDALAQVRALAEAAGAVTLELAAARHDTLVALASHLPYTVASALATTAEQASWNDPALWQITAGGFRDTTRVAAGDETMMLDILLTNRDAIIGAIRDFQFALDQFTVLLERGDEDGLNAYVSAAAETRRRLATR